LSRALRKTNFPIVDELNTSSTRVLLGWRVRASIRRYVDRFITIAGLTVSGVWLTVLALAAVLQRF